MSDVSFPDDWEKFGPKLKALPTDKMRMFVWAYVHNGGQMGLAAAQSGYAGTNERSASSIASRLMARQDILDACEELTWRRLNGMAILAVNALEPILNNASHKSHAKAIEMVLERTGFVAERKLLVEKPTTKSDEAILSTLAELCKKLGADPTQFLGPLASKLNVVDAEVVEETPPRALPKPAKKAPMPSNLDDLSDLL